MALYPEAWEQNMKAQTDEPLLSQQQIRSQHDVMFNNLMSLQAKLDNLSVMALSGIKVIQEKTLDSADTSFGESMAGLTSLDTKTRSDLAAAVSQLTAVIQQTNTKNNE